METDERVPTPILLSKRFKRFRKDIRDIWESYNLVAYYFPHIHRALKRDNLPPFRFVPLMSNVHKEQGKDNTYGAISHLIRKANPRRCLVDAVGTFEDYIVTVVAHVYRDFPGKLLSSSSSSSPPQDLRILQTVVGSSTREEILDKLAEEKIRSIFYGNPVEFFTRDRARLEFGDFFSKNHSTEIRHYSEIIGRRNLLLHRGGRVDRKYLRENPKSELTLGERLKLTDSYLRDGVALLEGLAAVVTDLVHDRIYHSRSSRGALVNSLAAFRRWEKTT